VAPNVAVPSESTGTPLARGSPPTGRDTMGLYETEPGVDPVRITTIRRLRRRWKHGEQPTEDQGLFDDLFVATTKQR